MNPSTVDELAPPPQPHRLSTSCDLHPEERFSGFCPSCLCDRLSVLDHTVATTSSSSSSRKLPTMSAATLKSIFKPNANDRNRDSFFPELRRSKSFSVKNKEGLSGGVEPQRRSCDVKLRDEHRDVIEDESMKSSVSETVFEEEAENGCHFEIVKDSGDEIREEKSNEIVEEIEEFKLMKDYMDLYPQTKKPSARDFAGSFWSAASRKLQKWRQKQKIKKPRSDGDEGRKELPVEKTTGRKFRDTQSEGFGRRSGDTDPRFSFDTGRFSVDIGRMSLDDPRYSLDEPRALWDGHMIGRTTAKVPPPPSMLSVVENAPVLRSEMQIPVEVPSSSSSISPINGEFDPIIITPGGSNQTRDYYTEPPSRRRKSLDRSNSLRKTVATENKPVSNSKVSPATTVESNPRTMTDDYSEIKANQNGDKKSRRWGKWSILGFIYRKGIRKDDGEDKYGRSNSTGMVERSISESWPELGNEGGPKMKRSNSNVSWRRSDGGSARNKSLRHSPKDGENGMLRFYLPMKSSWRTGDSGGGDGSGRREKTAARENSHGHSIARRVMRLY